MSHPAIYLSRTSSAHALTAIFQIVCFIACTGAQGGPGPVVWQAEIVLDHVLYQSSWHVLLQEIHRVLQALLPLRPTSKHTKTFCSPTDRLVVFSWYQRQSSCCRTTVLFIALFLLCSEQPAKAALQAEPGHQ